MDIVKLRDSRSNCCTRTALGMAGERHLLLYCKCNSWWSCETVAAKQCPAKTFWSTWNAIFSKCVRFVGSMQCSLAWIRGYAPILEISNECKNFISISNGIFSNGQQWQHMNFTFFFRWFLHSRWLALKNVRFSKCR